ncbi:hypothetical protein TGP89_418750 [Toxoplasma gondii p89]|uniref:Uncharacterized protein n=1 Tax=Toxoplasma gondii p89 TaxID=943119 RepID=A0A086KXZ0_TOXGO|nr:hypothetical protein TGP89_418750 [Toxoplasma gondii p89]
MALFLLLFPLRSPERFPSRPGERDSLQVSADRSGQAVDLAGVSLKKEARVSRSAFSRSLKRAFSSMFQARRRVDQAGTKCETLFPFLKPPANYPQPPPPHTKLLKRGREPEPPPPSGRPPPGVSDATPPCRTEKPRKKSTGETQEIGNGENKEKEHRGDTRDRERRRTKLGRKKRSGVEVEGQERRAPRKTKKEKRTGEKVGMGKTPRSGEGRKVEAKGRKQEQAIKRGYNRKGEGQCAQRKRDGTFRRKKREFSEISDLDEGEVRRKPHKDSVHLRI